ncbi:hypothetical protein GJ744_001296 [Endocarpon pusillum]|uniref:Uncharacterized protein n=1 Tax=Endocarpon pusillum TaxID=364733 RepID=A0A8H7E0N9_9EURO|nr:hypothetical protein GJ744_001296 [Endocarpon pusillum]
MSFNLTTTEITKGRQSLKELQDWLPNAQYDKRDGGNWEYRINADLKAKVIPLLKDLELQHMGYTLWRISIRTTIGHRTTGAAYLIPIHVISGTPSLGQECLQIPGQFTKYQTQVDLTPELDCIFVVPQV